MRACVSAVVVVSAILSVSPAPLAATRMEQALMKLDPEERAHQACVARGLDAVRSDRRLRQADRLMPDVFKRAKLAHGVVTAKGAAVRAGKHWYELTFECKVSDDQLEATSFTFRLGGEIPPEIWEEVGLWQ